MFIHIKSMNLLYGQMRFHHNNFVSSSEALNGYNTTPLSQFCSHIMPVDPFEGIGFHDGRIHFRHLREQVMR